jgi:hypothetical protein
MQSFGGAKPVVSNANSKNRRSHNTAERINSISKVLDVLQPPPREAPSGPGASQCWPCARSLPDYTARHISTGSRLLRSREDTRSRE